MWLSSFLKDVYLSQFIRLIMSKWWHNLAQNPEGAKNKNLNWESFFPNQTVIPCNNVQNNFTIFS